MVLLVILCLVVAIVLFLLAAWNKVDRVGIGWIGLAFVALALLLPPLVGAIH